MASDLDLYVSLCRTLGPCTDLIQGAGGNISVKDLQGTMYIKSSGIIMADTTHVHGWVRVPVSSLTTVLEGTGKPSMEAIFHTLPRRIIVHLHSIHHLNVLCSPDFQPGYRNGILYIGYFTPGEELGASILRAHRDNETAQIIYLQNHGVIYLADTEDEIYDLISTDIERHAGSFPLSDILGLRSLRRDISDVWQKDILAKPCPSLSASNPIPTIRNYTPDMALFLHAHELQSRLQPSIWCNKGIIYAISTTLLGCYSIEELLLAYSAIGSKAQALPDAEVSALFNSDKEKARLASAGR